MKKIIFALALLISCACAAAQSKADSSRIEAERGFTSSPLTYQMIPAFNNTWGYDIYADNKLIVHQPLIPGMPGREGFKTKEAAAKVAERVIEKMKKGEMPPVITEKEMRDLKVLQQ